MGKEYTKDTAERSNRIRGFGKVKKRRNGRGMGWTAGRTTKRGSKYYWTDLAGDNVRTGYTSEYRK
jgi:hypothetical protein